MWLGSISEDVSDDKELMEFRCNRGVMEDRGEYSGNCVLDLVTSISLYDVTVA